LKPAESHEHLRDTLEVEISKEGDEVAGCDWIEVIAQARRRGSCASSMNFMSSQVQHD
jgi:hypothetical protein